MRLSSLRERSMPCRHWPPSPPLRPRATCRSERMGMGDHFTSSAAGAPAGLSVSAACPAGERAANSAMIEVTTIDRNNRVLMLTYLPDLLCFGRGGLAFERNSLRKLKSPPKIGGAEGTIA